MAPVMSSETIKALHDLTKLEQPELEALYEQFKVLADTEFNDTKYHVNGAISRSVFDRCFLPNHHVSPTSPNLIHDRMFAFYDINNDGLISFEEFLLGVSFTSNKTHPSNSPEKIRKIFQGYDLDNDGYVSRHDFQRMFKAFYSLSKDVIRDIVASQGEDHYDAQHMDMVLMGRQPISAAFTSSIPPATEDEWQKPLHPQQENNDFVEVDSDARATVSASSDRRTPPADGYLGDKKKDNDNKSLDEVEKHRRWKYWAYPVEDIIPRDDDEEEYELPAYERDVGSEVLYQMSWQAINELLDTLFKAKESEASLLHVVENGERQKQEGTQKKMELRKPKLDESENESEEDEDDGVKIEKEDEDTPVSSFTAITGIPSSEDTPAVFVVDTAATTTTTISSPAAAVSNSPLLSESTTLTSPSTTSIETKKHSIRLAQIEKIREEIRERGGPGKLNFEEFKKIMSDKETSRKLEFVGTWTGLASF